MLSNKHTIITKILVVACLAGLLGSCGFRLRGDVEVPPQLQNVAITGVAQYADLYQELKRVLQRSGSEVSTNRSLAKAVIVISAAETRKRVLSVDTQGRAAEYELNYRFFFSVVENTSNTEIDAQQPGQEKILVPQQKLELTRDFRFDPNNVLATDAEEKQIRLELVQFAVRQMMRRIRSHLKYAGQ